MIYANSETDNEIHNFLKEIKQLTFINKIHSVTVII